MFARARDLLYVCAYLWRWSLFFLETTYWFIYANMLLIHGRWSKICKLRSIVQKIISEPNSYFRPCSTLKWQPPIPQWCHKYAIAGKKFNSFNLCILTFLDLVLITLDCMAIQKNSTNMRTKIINTVWTKQIHRHTHTHTLDLKRENHRKSKEIKINEPNLKLWMLFKVVVSNPFEHEQRLCVVKVSGLDLL